MQQQQQQQLEEEQQAEQQDAQPAAAAASRPSPRAAAAEEDEEPSAPTPALPDDHHLRVRGASGMHLTSRHPFVSPRLLLCKRWAAAQRLRLLCPLFCPCCEPGVRLE